MARCNFSISFNDTPENIISKANAAIKNAGGVFNGTAANGQFELSTPIGSVVGSYAIEASLINIQIDNKPIFLSCSKIQSELQNYLKS